MEAALLTLIRRAPSLDFRTNTRGHGAEGEVFSSVSVLWKGLCLSVLATVASV